MASDYRVKFRSEEKIAAIASRLREIIGIDELQRISPREALLYFQREGYGVKGKLSIRSFDARSGDNVAEVMFRPLALRVDRETWDLAGMGDPESNFILAHEIGHIVLHDFDSKAFPVNPVDVAKFGFAETSAEWQADRFAENFLLPDYIQFENLDPEQAMLRCGVNRELATRLLKRRERIFKGRHTPIEPFSFF